MKICHLMPYSPHRSGLYETAREIIYFENKLGHEAKFFDTGGSNNPYLIDRGVESCSKKFLKECDIVVMHQMLSNIELFKSIDKPILLILHGTPKDCFWGELYEGFNSYSTILTLIDDPRFLFVTLWKRHLQFWKPLMGDKVSYVPSCVDLSKFHPKIEPYKFLGSSYGDINILFGDTWRIDKNPFEIVHAFKIFKETDIGERSRIHIYCKDNKHQYLWEKFLSKLFDNKDYYLGEFSGMIEDFPNVIKSCDFVVTPQRDATRVIRESLAIGTPVVALDGCEFTRFTADHYYPEKFSKAMEKCALELKANKRLIENECRKTAEESFNPKVTAAKIVNILESVLCEKVY